MTLLPSDEFGIRGYPGDQYELHPVCCVPGCEQRAVHGHHLWPRSFLRGQPYEWVRLPDGTLLGNRIGMCSGHHEGVTGEIGGHKARIVWEAGVFWWEIRVESMAVRAGADIPPLDEYKPTVQWLRLGLLDPQPPGANARQDTARTPPAEDEPCPTCGHHKRPKRTPLDARPKKTWTVVVPADAEDGAEVLNTLVEALAVTLGMEEWSTRLQRYFVLAKVLAWALQHEHELLDDEREAATA